MAKNTEEYEEEGNLMTALVCAITYPKNLAKAVGATVYHKVANTGDERDLMDHLSDFMERDCEPWMTKKRKNK